MGDKVYKSALLAVQDLYGSGHALLADAEIISRRFSRLVEAALAVDKRGCRHTGAILACEDCEELRYALSEVTGDKL